MFAVFLVLVLLFVVIVVLVVRGRLLDDHRRRPCRRRAVDVYISMMLVVLNEMSDCVRFRDVDRLLSKAQSYRRVAFRFAKRKTAKSKTTRTCLPRL